MESFILKSTCSAQYYYNIPSVLIRMSCMEELYYANCILYAIYAIYLTTIIEFFPFDM